MLNERKDKLTNKQVKISCIIPVYNEAEGIISFLSALHLELNKLSKNHEIIVVDDGSSDELLPLIAELTAKKLNSKLVTVHLKKK